MKRSFVVLQAFDAYASGTVIDDAGEIDRLLASEHAGKLRERKSLGPGEYARAEREAAIAPPRLQRRDLRRCDLPRHGRGDALTRHQASCASIAALSMTDQTCAILPSRNS